MAGRLAKWIVRKIGLRDEIEAIHSDMAERVYDSAVNAADVAVGNALRNHSNRMLGAENSLRLVENRLAMIEALRIADGEIGELAARRQKAEDDANRDRLDASAAMLRGQTLEQYRADKEKRRREKYGDTAETRAE